MENFPFIVIGGGISGVTCVESIATFDPTAKILLLTGTPLVKAINNYVQVTKFLEDFDVEEKPFSFLAEKFSNLTILNKIVDRLDVEEKIVFCSDQSQFRYEQLCICTGARPKLIDEKNPFVVAIRDTETVKTFEKRLAAARRVLIIGNGGIATELVYEIENCSVIWAIRDEHISTNFLDEPAARFFLEKIQNKKETEKLAEKRLKFELDDQSKDEENPSTKICGGALGPDWALNRSMKGSSTKDRDVQIEYKVELEEILTDYQSDESWPVFVKLTNGKIYGCDLIVSAIGVTPNVEPFLRSANFSLGSDGGLLVDEHLKTSVKDIFACGDVCSAGWNFAEHWFQMRLWCQARQMGHYAGKAMLANRENQLDSLTLDFCFELFAHTTRFFNMKVVLLGKYHENEMKNHENLVRMTPNEEYVRVTLKNGRVHGCIFIGETELEETFENLILNQIDVSQFAENLLDPNIDIADYFD